MTQMSYLRIVRPFYFAVERPFSRCLAMPRAPVCSLLFGHLSEGDHDSSNPV